MSTPHILMCPPDFYGIEYEINPWMNTTFACDHAEATRQWDALHAILEKAGARITLVEPVPGLPDLVFTANAALIYHQTAWLSRFRHAQRQGEEPYFANALANCGFDVRSVPEDLCFEGAGDALFCGDTLLAGYRMRSDARGIQEIGAMLGVRVIPLELVDPHFYHLDTCFCPLNDDTAVYYPNAFDRYGHQVLGELVDNLIPVSKDEAVRFACNAVVLGMTVVTGTGCPKLHNELKHRGYEPVETPLAEFLKAGGSAKCLTLRLDGEDAASWKRIVDQ